MKDGLARPAIDRIAAALETVHPPFKSGAFKRRAMKGLGNLELKDRVGHIIGALGHHLPDAFPEAARILKRIPPIWDFGDPEDSLASFAAWPLTDYVAARGGEHPRLALTALKKLTRLFSAEFAIRRFLLEHPDLTYGTLDAWSRDRDEHVRRLVSEGTRPRLPWGVQLKPAIADPARGLALLEGLKDDPSLYVRRSVANHLNDVAKDHPDTCVAVCRRWLKGADESRRWIIRHATRTLVKAGRPDVFPLLGYTENPRLKISRLELDRDAIRLGESITFSASIQSNASRRQRFVVDYAVHHQKANGQQTPKVFKLLDLELAAGETRSLAKTHAIRPITTRRYHSGPHAVELLINGKSVAKAEFHLTV